MPSDTSQLQVAMRCRIHKAAEGDEERVVTGVVLQPGVIDAHDDIVSEEVIKEAAYSFLSEYNLEGELGVQHKAFDQNIELVESYVAPADFVLNGEAVLKGSWLVSVRILDDALWNQVKTGELTGFSIGAIATVHAQAA